MKTSRSECHCGRSFERIQLSVDGEPVIVMGCTIHAGPGSETAQALAEVARAVRRMGPEQIKALRAANQRGMN